MVHNTLFAHFYTQRRFRIFLKLRAIKDMKSKYNLIQNYSNELVKLNKMQSCHCDRCEVMRVLIYKEQPDVLPRTERRLREALVN